MGEKKSGTLTQQKFRALGKRHAGRLALISAETVDLIQMPSMSEFLSGQPSAIEHKKAGLRIVRVRSSSRMNGQKENAPPTLIIQ